MKTPLLILLLLSVSITNKTLAQKNKLVATILGETNRKPMTGLEVRISAPGGRILTKLTTDSTGKIEYPTDQTFLELDIRSNNLDFKSAFKQVRLIPDNPTIEFYFLAPRDPEEVEQIKQGLQKLPGDKNEVLANVFCPNFISGTQDTATFKEVYSCLIKNMKYPEEAQELGIEGKIKVKFIIDENGKICNLELVNSNFAILEEEALRAAACLSGMTPATCDGKKVPTYYVLPVSFRLN